MRRWGWLALLALCLQAGADEMHYTFDATTDGWQSLDPTATLERVTAAEAVREGAGALAFRYRVREGAMPAVGAMGITPPDGFQSVQLWAHPAVDTVLVLVANELDGSSYNLPVYLRARRWTQVQVRLEEFVLGDDQFDENGRLDPEEVNAFMLFDAAVFLRQLTGAAAGEDERVLRLDDVRLTDREVAPRCPVRPLPDGGRARWLAPPAEEPAPWLPATGTLALEREEEETVLHWSYSLLDQGFSILLLANPGSLEGARTVRLRVRCPHDTVLGLSLEEQQAPGVVGEKPSYAVQQQVVGSPDWQTFTIPIEAFVADPQKPDPDGRLDLARVAGVMLFDAAGFGGATRESHDLWIGEISVELGP